MRKDALSRSTFFFLEKFQSTFQKLLSSYAIKTKKVIVSTANKWLHLIMTSVNCPANSSDYYGLFATIGQTQNHIFHPNKIIKM